MPERRVLFVGDSVTDAGRTSGRGSDLGAGYVRFAHDTIRESSAPYAVTNTGISGDRVRDLRARWDRDVLSRRPDVLTVLVGINDTWRRYDSEDPTSADEFEADYAHLLDEAATAGIPEVVLMEPFVVPVTAEQYAWRTEDLDEKIAVVHALAERRGHRIVELDRVLNEAGRRHGADAIAEDGVHPSLFGHRLIAAEWWKTMVTAG